MFQERMGVVYPDKGWEMRVEEMGGVVDPNFSPLPPAHRQSAAVGGLVQLRGSSTKTQNSVRKEGAKIT